MQESYTEKEYEKMAKRFPKFLARFRSEIPEIRNKVPVLDELTNDMITFLINISNRTDGKTFQYVNFFVQFAIEFDIGFCFMIRHYDLRTGYMENIEDVFRKEKRLNFNHLSFQKRNEYTMVFNKDKCIGIIVELTNATDFKYHASIAYQFPMIWYDEFLALKQDYIRGEWEAIKTIYETINRFPYPIPIIGKPKIIFGGNPVNFDSPVLLELNLFNSLEATDLGKLVKVGHTALIIEQNKEVNKLRNTSAFGGENDPMTTATFVMNKTSIVPDILKSRIIADGDSFLIKLAEINVGVFYLMTDIEFQVFVSVMSNRYVDGDIAYCELLADKSDKTIFLTESYFRDFTSKYDKELILFDNVFSKNTLTENPYFMNINLFKLIRNHYYTEKSTIQTKEDKFKKAQLNAQKDFLKTRFLDVYKGF